MNFLNIMKVSTLSLGRNKLRSFLTMLGIIIGVGAVITMMAVGTGAQVSIQQTRNKRSSNIPGIFESRRCADWHRIRHDVER